MLSKRYISVPSQTPGTSAGQEINIKLKLKRENGKYIFSQGVILIWKEFLQTSKENEILMKKNGQRL